MKVILMSMVAGNVRETFAEIEDDLTIGDALIKEVRFQFTKYMRGRNPNGIIDCCIMFVDPKMQNMQWRYFMNKPIPISAKYLTKLFWASRENDIHTEFSFYQ
jgi:hypothetical protein